MSVCLSVSTTASNKSCLDPEFLKAIPIMKTRSGMQVYTWVVWVRVFKASAWSYVLSCVHYTHVLNIITALYVFECTALCTCTWTLHMCHMHVGYVYACLYPCM